MLARHEPRRTHRSVHPPFPINSSAFLTVIDRQNSFVLTSHKRARRSAYTTSRLSSPKQTRMSGNAEPGMMYKLGHHINSDLRRAASSTYNWKPSMTKTAIVPSWDTHNTHPRRGPVEAVLNCRTCSSGVTNTIQRAKSFSVLQMMLMNGLAFWVTTLTRHAKTQ